MKYIYRQNRRYNYYDTYTDWEEAHRIALYYKRKNKCKYFILKYEHGFLFPETRYKLYLDKIIRLRFFGG